MRHLGNPNTNEIDLVEEDGLAFSPSTGWTEFTELVAAGDGGDGNPVQEAYDTADYILKDTAIQLSNELRVPPLISDLSNDQVIRCIKEAQSTLNNLLGENPTEFDQIGTILAIKDQINKNLDSLTTNPSSPYFGKTQSFVKSLVLQKISACSNLNFSTIISEFNSKFPNSVESLKKVEALETKLTNEYPNGDPFFEPKFANAIADCQNLKSKMELNLIEWLTIVNSISDVSPETLKQFGFQKSDTNSSFSRIRENPLQLVPILWFVFGMSCLALTYYSFVKPQVESNEASAKVLEKKAQILKLADQRKKLNCNEDSQSDACKAINNEISQLTSEIEILEEYRASLRENNFILEFIRQLNETLKYSLYIAGGIFAFWGLKKIFSK